MEISQLRTLIHVAELGSLSKAADRLHIAQPALSRQIRLLEEELGVQLFERHGRGMTLTLQGHDVMAHAQTILSEMDEIRATVADEDAPLRGHVAIGMPPTVSDILAEPLVAAFQQAHPEATLRIVSAYSGYLLDWIHRGEIEATVLYDPKSARTLHLRPLVEEDLLLITRPGAYPPETAVLPFAALEEERLLLPSRGHGLRTIVDRCAEESGFQLNVPVEADSYATLKQLVKGGHGSTLLPLAPIHDEIAQGALQAIPLEGPKPRRKLVIGYPTDRPVSRLARFAEQVIAAEVIAMVQRGQWAGSLLASAEPEPDSKAPKRRRR